MVRIFTALAAALTLPQQSLASHDSTTANPIRRVVTLLQKMQEKVTTEGKAEKELFDKFMCYCKTGSGDLSASIDAADSKVESDSSSLKAAKAQSVQLSSDLKGHQSDRADAKDAVAKAKGLRKKEAATFAKDSSDAKTNLAALGKAINAIETGAGGSFLQTTAAAKLRKLTIDMDMSSADREVLASFLSVTQTAGYIPQSGEITGILKQMKDTMAADLASITGTEEQAIKDFDALIAAKEKEIASTTKSIEDKTERLGQVNVDIVNLEEEVDDTSKALAADQKFLANLKTSCGTKESEWAERSKTRTQELLALADTIKLLNDDDALELFKKSLPSPSLLQTKASSKVVTQKALKILKGNAKQQDPRMDLVMLALTGHQTGGFDKVLKMIDDMVALLGREQTDDDGKKVYCEKEIDATEDQKKDLELSASDLSKAMDDSEESISTFAAEIKALIAGIKALDKSVADATAQRQAENTEFKSTMAANKATEELIGLAKNRLMKFYNPKLYVAPSKVELSAEQRIAVNMDSEAAPTVAPSGISGTGITYVQIAAHQASSDDVAPPPAPETWDAYQKKGQEQSGVTAMMDMLIADVAKDMSESEVDEKNAQAEYELFMQDSQNKRATDSKSVSDKEGAKAESEARLQKMGAEHKSTLQRDYATATALKDLHLECDWLLSSFQARKEARVGEVDSLKKAKAVLSGADYSFVQRTAIHLRGASQ